MPRELRKRKEVAEPTAAPPAKKKGTVGKAVEKVKGAVSSSSKAASASTKVAVGETIDLEGFGGEIETNDGVKTTLKKLVEESKHGVVLFTYPKASTPGCTKQVCLFRDSYTPLSATGFSIYGLSKDSTKANTTFKTKQNLPYPLLCDVGGTLISAIGLKKAPAGIQRGVFVVDKFGKVLAAQPGSPSGTVEVVEKLLEGGAASNGTTNEKPVNGATKDEIKAADTSAEVADDAEEIDSNEGKGAA